MTAIMIEAALRALVFAAAVGTGLRLLRVNNVPARKAVWSIVLLASVAMPFLMRLPVATGWGRVGWTVPVQMKGFAEPQPALQAAPAPLAPILATTEDKDSGSAETAVAPSPIAISAAEDDAPAVVPDAPDGARSRWALLSAGRILTWTYLVIAGALLFRLFWGLGAALRLWITADLVSPLVAPEPNVRSSKKIQSPVTIGSGIVLPANYTEWDMKKLRTVLAHERSHVRQLDFYLQLLAGLYTAMFWFSPLGWWLRRILASLGEAIGDRAGIDVAASRSRYAEILLEFAAMPRQALPGVAMARPGNLSHRIERLLNEHLFRSAFAEGRRRAAISLLLIPVALFAATAMIHVPRAGAQTAPPAPSTAPAPAAAPAPQAPASPAVSPDAPPNQVAPAPVPLPAAPNSAVAPVVPAMAPPVGVGPAAPVPPINDSDTTTVVSDDDQTTYGYAFRFSDNGDSYAIVDSGPGKNVTFSGDWNWDRRGEIDAARKVAKGPFLWFTHEGKSYIVTDPAIVAKIRAMYKPMEALGRQQQLLGQQQGTLGKQQQDLERAQEEAGVVRMPDLSKEMAELNDAVARASEDRNKWDTKELAEAEAKLKAAQDQMLTPEKVAELQAQLAAAQAEWNSERMAEMQAKLGELQARLGQLQGEAGARQGEFGEKIGALGAQQGRLGAEEGRLGAEEGKFARQTDQQVRGIIDECLRDGKATQVPNVQ